MNIENRAQPFQQTSQLLLRNPKLLAGSTLLVVNYPDDALLPVLREQFAADQVIGFTHDYATHRSMQALRAGKTDAPFELIYAATCPANLHCDLAIVYLPKSRQLTSLILQMTAAVLSPGGRLLLVGHNDAGIRSCQPLLETTVGPTRKVDTARHCVLLQATLQTKAPPFDLDAWKVNYAIAVADHNLTVTSFPGVFSHGRLDAGTQLLLSAIQTPAGERVLDFGCGAGVIGGAIQMHWPTTTVELVDTHALALVAARGTLAANGLSTAQVYPSAIFSDVQGVYDWIISNPPFHQGVQVDYQIAAQFLAEAARFLKPGGVLQIVANRFLKYQPLMEYHIGQCRVIAENRSYCVYEAIQRKP